MNVGYFTSDSGRLYNESNPPDPTNLNHNVTSKFFGYTMAFYQESTEGKIALIIGSPGSKVDQTDSQTNSTEAAASVHLCGFSTSLFFDESSSECNMSYPSGTLSEDGFGQVVAISQDGNMKACSPTKKQVCDNNYYSPGFCYVSSDSGSSWTKDAQTDQLRCPAGHVDVLFVIDGSRSVEDANFQIVIAWVKNVTKKLDLESGHTSVGVVQYSAYDPGQPINDQTYIKTEIEIGQETNQTSFEAAVGNISYYQYTTPTGYALRKVMFDFNGTKNYGSHNNKQVMILLTDGKANAADQEFIPEAAAALRDMGVIIFSVGVGDAQPTELQIIANGAEGNNERVELLTNFEDLDSIVDELGTEIRAVNPEGGAADLYNQTGFSIAYSKKNGKLQSKK
uniref:cartilage matrix protein-like isoform X3 n=1 Tax=Styela clava TaxID=7725 RepID=UPI00193A6C33|nr:cartilage matrix protein-like isoform X3 [Styela clava]